jgi:hypothetical protein
MEAELAARRRLAPLMLVEHAAFVLVLLSGLVLMERLGWGPWRARWFSLKLGLVAFLVLPLEAFQAWVAQSWIAPGLRHTTSPPFSKDLARGIAMQEMLWALAAPLLVLALPLLLWLCFARPF